MAGETDQEHARAIAEQIIEACDGHYRSFGTYAGDNAVLLGTSTLAIASALSATADTARAQGKAEGLKEGRWECPWCGDRVDRVLKPAGGCLTAEVNGRIWHPVCANEYEELRARATPGDTP